MGRWPSFLPYLLLQHFKFVKLLEEYPRNEEKARQLFFDRCVLEMPQKNLQDLLAHSRWNDRHKFYVRVCLFCQSLLTKYQLLQRRARVTTWNRNKVELIEHFTAAFQVRLSVQSLVEIKLENRKQTKWRSARLKLRPRTRSFRT